MSSERTIIVDVFIENAYADGERGTVVEIDLELPEPPTTEPGEPLDRWADVHLHPLTGVGHAGVHASYQVTLTRSTLDELVLRSWSWSG